MDGKTIRKYLSQEVNALVARYKQFEALVPALDHAGSQHPGEDGRYVESLVRNCLSKFLPRDLEVKQGFIVRPAVKTGENGKERHADSDEHSTQLDIIVFDSAKYPVFHRFADAIIVPPEGVIGILSVKKTLHLKDIEAEVKALKKAARLCRTLDDKDKPRRGPYLGLIGMNCSSNDMTKNLFDKISAAYSACSPPTFDEIIGFIGAINKGSIFKKRPYPKDTPEHAEFIGHEYEDGETHLALQLLITGMASVYYDRTRNTVRRPGFTAFKSQRPANPVGCIPVAGLREKC